MDPKRIEWLLRTKVKKMVPYQKHWLIYTVDDQKWIAKKRKNKEHLRWWFFVDQELRNKGFQAMPVYYTDGYELVVTPWIQGEIGSYRNLDLALKMVQHLAYFHQIGQELQTPPKQEVAFLFFNRLYHRLKQFYKLMKKVDAIPGQLGKLLAQYGPHVYADGYRVWQKLKQFPFQEYVRWERERHCLAHRDLASHNWILGKKKIWLIDFDLAEYDSQLGDVWQMFTRIMAEHQFSPKLYRALLKSYESIRPLNELERKMLDVLIFFPNEFMRESIGLVKNHQGYSLSTSLPYLERMAINRYRKKLQSFPYLVD